MVVGADAPPLVAPPAPVLSDVPEPTAVEEEQDIKRMIALTMGASWVETFRCESQLDPLAIGDAGERGLAQIHPINFGLVAELGYTPDDLLLPAVNLEVAKVILESQGPGAWACRD